MVCSWGTRITTKCWIFQLRLPLHTYTTMQWHLPSGPAMSFSFETFRAHQTHEPTFRQISWTFVVLGLFEGGAYIVRVDLNHKTAERRDANLYTSMLFMKLKTLRFSCLRNGANIVTFHFRPFDIMCREREKNASNDATCAQQLQVLCHVRYVHVVQPHRLTRSKRLKFSEEYLIKFHAFSFYGKGFL